MSACVYTQTEYAGTSLAESEKREGVGCGRGLRGASKFSLSILGFRLRTVIVPESSHIRVCVYIFMHVCV